MRLLAPMTGRDPSEHERAATPLELFFDLTFVVAIAQAAVSLHHGLVEDHVRDALIGFPMVFFAVFWAWVNFTWFASAYDTDDVVYRLATFVQMTGVLIVAAGVPRAFEERDLAVIVLGYVVMRLAAVAQWLRVAHADPPSRPAALRFAGGTAVVQVGWIACLALPHGWLLAAFVLLAVAELAVPFWAEAPARTAWHPSHIVERYRLFTIIVLGESILAATVGVQTAIDADGRMADLLPVIVGGLLTVFALWWIYFSMPADAIVTRARQDFESRRLAAFVWSYGHLAVFGGAAATGAGLAVAVDQVTGQSELGDRAAAAAITLPVCLYLLAVWLLHVRDKEPGLHRAASVPIAVAALLIATFTPEPVLACGVILTLLVASHVVADRTTRPAW